MTQRALGLAQAADVLVSAAGYNSVHEVLYHGIATIFIPQMASYMDDQERRARALSDRDLAVTVSADELMALQRHLADFLEGDKAAEIRANLQAQTLPDTGTERAARLVEEVAGYVR
jgi:UDP-N-acetylglucosamine:LPS N-acetylglucosamine transferase